MLNDRFSVNTTYQQLLRELIPPSFLEVALNLASKIVPFIYYPSTTKCHSFPVVGSPLLSQFIVDGIWRDPLTDLFSSVSYTYFLGVLIP